MLVLGRKPGEYIMIGEDIMVKVVRSNDGDLRLAIEAPKCLNIMRGELYEAKLGHSSCESALRNLTYGAPDPGKQVYP